MTILSNPPLLRNGCVCNFQPCSLSSSYEEKMNNRFSNAASTYDQHAAPQLELIEALLEQLPATAPHRILDVGAGTGLLTEKIATRYPTTPIDAIDLSEEMIEQSQKRLHHLPQIDWIQADAETYVPQQPYTLIVSSAALHWSPNLTATLQNLYNALQPGGHFLLGLMLRGTLWELRELRRRIAPTKGIGLTLPTENIVTEQINISASISSTPQPPNGATSIPTPATFFKLFMSKGSPPSHKTIS